MMALSAIQTMMMLKMVLLFFSFSSSSLHLFVSSFLLSIFSDYELWPTQLTQNKR